MYYYPVYTIGYVICNVSDLIGKYVGVKLKEALNCEE